MDAGNVNEGRITFLVIMRAKIWPRNESLMDVR